MINKYSNLNNDHKKIEEIKNMKIENNIEHLIK